MKEFQDFYYIVPTDSDSPGSLSKKEVETKVYFVPENEGEFAHYQVVDTSTGELLSVARKSLDVALRRALKYIDNYYNTRFKTTLDKWYNSVEK